MRALAIGCLDFVFGCHHKHLSRVFTIAGRTYRVCCDCGRRSDYSWETMRVVHRGRAGQAINRPLRWRYFATSTRGRDNVSRFRSAGLRRSR